MRLKKIFELAINYVIHSKIRSWLTILGIIIGVSSFVAILSLGQGMQQDINNRMGSMQVDQINITTGFSRAGRAMPSFGVDRGGGGVGGRQPETATADLNLTNKDISAIKSIPNIAVISTEVSGRETVYYNGESIDKSITGVDVINWLQITNIELTSGRLLGPADKYSVLIGDRMANQSFSKVIPVNSLIIINNKSFRVVGIITNSQDIIIPQDVAYTALSDTTPNQYDRIIIKANNVDAVDALVVALDSKLILSRHVTTKKKDFSVTAIKTNIERMSEMSSSMILFLAVIAAISLIVGAIGIANTMFTSVLEKTKEIGIMKSIGASNLDIMLIFICTSAFYGVVGGVLGVLLGGAISGTLGSYIGIAMIRTNGNSALSLSLALYGILLAIGISVLSGFFPAYRASKLKPVDALRYE
ncbi:MAG: ABC transporter permease [archaeon]|jgi:putative ABC transport system permease protein